MGLIHMPLKRTETAHGGVLGHAYTYLLPNARKRRHGPENGVAGHCPGEEKPAHCPGKEKPAHGGQRKTPRVSPWGLWGSDYSLFGPLVIMPR